MEAAVIKSKPRIGAAVRDGLNRFCLVEAMETDEKKGLIRLVRLAAISRVHLVSVRRTARGIKFQLCDEDWQLKLKLGLGAPKIAFPVDQREMFGIIGLLGVLVHLTFSYDMSTYTSVDWKDLQRVAKYVSALSVYDEADSPDFFAFIDTVAPHLKMLNSTWSLLTRFPPLYLKRARLYDPPYNDFSELNRHKIHRLDVPAFVPDHLSEIQSNQIISRSIKASGILHIRNWVDFPYDSIEIFCCCFPSAEDLHIVCEYERSVGDLDAYFTALWAKCLEIRDRLHVAGLKRLFITIKHNCNFQGVCCTAE
ncbi:hypothetical protein M3Y99_00698000 [Aphelenchoides fujianensis]|nr:hypothetical protein M3Y99_00698000 [Aphelenchoides fujianensis]